jgi:hypothetical protein
MRLLWKDMRNLCQEIEKESVKRIKEDRVACRDKVNLTRVFCWVFQFSPSYDTSIDNQRPCIAHCQVFEELRTIGGLAPEVEAAIHRAFNSRQAHVPFPTLTDSSLEMFPLSNAPAPSALAPSHTSPRPFRVVPITIPSRPPLPAFLPTPQPAPRPSSTELSVTSSSHASCDSGHVPSQGSDGAVGLAFASGRCSKPSRHARQSKVAAIEVSDESCDTSGDVMCTTSYDPVSGVSTLRVLLASDSSSASSHCASDAPSPMDVSLQPQQSPAATDASNIMICPWCLVGVPISLVPRHAFDCSKSSSQGVR